MAYTLSLFLWEILVQCQLRVSYSSYPKPKDVDYSTLPRRSRLTTPLGPTLSHRGSARLRLWDICSTAGTPRTHGQKSANASHSDALLGRDNLRRVFHFFSVFFRVDAQPDAASPSTTICPQTSFSRKFTYRKWFRRILCQSRGGVASSGTAKFGTQDAKAPYAR